VESLMPLRLARYGVPLAETAPAGLSAAGIEPQLLPALPARAESPQPPVQGARTAQAVQASQAAQPAQAVQPEQPPAPAEEPPSQWFATPQDVEYTGDYDPDYEPDYDLPAYYVPEPGDPQEIPLPQPRAAESRPVPAQEQAQVQEQVPDQTQAPAPEPQVQVPNGAGGVRPLGKGAQDGAPSTDEELYQVFRRSIAGEGMPTPGAFAANVEAEYGLRLQSRELNHYMDQFTARLNNELMEDHIA
ncbi:hypothetical protein K7472_30640, partial [Streptomyces sp. PTM05]|nr:hypothetical protein [Streptantibioticus parmotrematis]